MGVARSIKLSATFGKVGRGLGEAWRKKFCKEDLFKEDGMFIVKMIINMSKKAFTESFKELILIKEIKSLDK